MLYRLFYYKRVEHRGNEYKALETKILEDLKNIQDYDIYYLTDINGNVIIDNREMKKGN